MKRIVLLTAFMMIVSAALAQQPPKITQEQAAKFFKAQAQSQTAQSALQQTPQFKAAQEKLLTEKSSLEAQLAVAKNALPLADQAAALHEQLRQTQDQLAALSLENNALKTRLATGPSSTGLSSSSTLQPSVVTVAPAPDPLPAAAPAPRTHVVAEGDTLTKISRQYYGTTSRWSEILAANRDVLRDEKSLVVGSKLRIP